MNKYISKVLTGTLLLTILSTPAYASIKLKDQIINTKQETVVEDKASTLNISDIATHWDKANIQKLVDQKAINGYPDGSFRPNNTISFAEFLSIAVKATVKDIKAVPQGSHWATGVYQTAIEKGIITPQEFAGTAESFNAPITREDAALIMMRINEVVQGEQKADISGVSSKIADYNNISASRQPYVLQAYTKGLLGGKGNGFDPKGNTTRAESATILVRLLEKESRLSVSNPTSSTKPSTPIQQAGDVSQHIVQVGENKGALKPATAKQYDLEALKAVKFVEQDGKVAVTVTAPKLADGLGDFTYVFTGSVEAPNGDLFAKNIDIKLNQGETKTIVLENYNGGGVTKGQIGVAEIAVRIVNKEGKCTVIHSADTTNKAKAGETYLTVNEVKQIDFDSSSIFLGIK